jgi:magnesium-transporting ATPase (P-type)
MSNDIKKVSDISALSVEEVFVAFETSGNGLNTEEVMLRREKYGKNVLTKAKTFSPIRQFLKQFVSVMAILLWVAGALSFVADMPELAIASWVVVIVNGVFSFLQEYKADKALSQLADMLPAKVRVIRNGERTEISAEDLCVGDVIEFEAGNLIPADARLVKSNKLFLNNSMLSGETVPLNRSEKPADSKGKAVSEIMNMVFAGTTVSQGSGTAVVYAIGNETEIGKVSKLAQVIEAGKSTLDIQINKVVKLITVIALVMGLASFAVTVFVSDMTWQLGFTFALGIIIANIPEGLLPTVNLSLAVGVQRMAKENALIKRLSSVETLSSATVICTDKTGTLTQNQLMVKKLWVPNGAVKISGNGYGIEGCVEYSDVKIKPNIEKLLTIGVLCSETNIAADSARQGFWSVMGSPSEGALLIAADKAGLSIENKRASYALEDIVPFSSEKKKMTVTVKNNNDSAFETDKRYVFCKGAPNVVLANCTRFLDGGSVQSMSEEKRKQFLQINDGYAQEGFRILAFGYKSLEETDADIDGDLCFVGLSVVYDPPREEVFDAVKSCKTAGIKITVITGDYGLTAAAIAKQVGIIDSDYINLNGVQVDELSEEELMNIVKTDIPIVFSRTTPQNKLKIVEAYKKAGETVAVTGDGVNDILALKSANIGIAMGKSGTDVARDAADMILLDDNFSTIVKAVEEGRAIYANIKKFMTYIFASNIAEMVPVIAMGLFGIPPALTVLQILAIDLGTDLLPALALGAEKPESGLLQQPPRKASDKLLDKKLLLRSYGFLGVIEAAVSMGLYLTVFALNGIGVQELISLKGAITTGTADATVMSTYIYATTMALMGVIFCQIGNVFACRSETESVLKSFKNHNKWIYIGIFVELLLAAAIVYIPFMQDIFNTALLKPTSLAMLAICPFILVAADEIRKAVAKKRIKSHERLTVNFKQKSDLK